MSVEQTAGAGHPICLAFLDAVTPDANQGYRFDPGALPALQDKLRALGDDPDRLLDAVFALLDLASFLRRERSPHAADDVIHLVVSCCGDALQRLGEAGSGLLSSFEAEQAPAQQRMHDLLGTAPAARTPRASPAPGSIPGPLARLATVAGPRPSRRSKKSP